MNERSCNWSVFSGQYAESIHMHFEALPPQGGSKVRGNLDKTLLSPIGNQYTVSLCQDLPGTTVMKFKVFCIKKFRQDFIYFKFNKLQNFCQDLSRFEKQLRNVPRGTYCKQIRTFDI